MYEVQITARYKDAAVHSALKALDDAVVALQGSKDTQELEAREDTVNTKFQLLAETMVAEVARNEF